MFSPAPTRSTDVIGDPSHGSLQTNAGNTRTIVSWDSHNEGPTKSTTVSKQSRTVGPGSRSESVTVQKQEVTRDRGLNVQRSQRSQSSSSYSRSEKQDRVGSPVEIMIGSPTPSRLHTVPYKIDYGDAYMPMDYFSDSEMPYTGNWLQQQQMKLRQKREGKGWGVRTQQEKQLVNELKSAQMRFTSKRAQSDAEEEAILAQYSNRELFAAQNGPAFIRSPSPEKTPPLIKPTTPEPPPRRHSSPPRRYSPPRSKSTPPHKSPPRKSRSPERKTHESFVFRTTSPRPVRREFNVTREFASPEPLRRSHSMDRHTSSSHKTEKTYYVSGLERPAFTTHQTKYVFSVSPPKSSMGYHEYHGSIRTKPPPSPAALRASAPTSPLIPQRGTSSKEAVIRSRTLSRDWVSPSLPRQNSDTSFDRYRDYSPPLSPTTLPANYSMPPETAAYVPTNYSMPPDSAHYTMPPPERATKQRPNYSRPPHGSSTLPPNYSMPPYLYQQEIDSDDSPSSVVE